MMTSIVRTERNKKWAFGQIKVGFSIFWPEPTLAKNGEKPKKKWAFGQLFFESGHAETQ